MSVIFENYSSFIDEHKSDFSSASGAARMLRDTSSFSAFSDALTEGLDESARETVKKILGRQRESILEEAANVSASAFTHRHN